jgi:hypothetical protein
VQQRRRIRQRAEKIKADIAIISEIKKLQE